MATHFTEVKIVLVFKDDFIFQISANLCIETGELFFLDYEIEKNDLKEEYIIFPSQEKRNVCKKCHKFLEKACVGDTCVYDKSLSENKKQDN